MDRICFANHVHFKVFYLKLMRITFDNVALTISTLLSNAWILVGETDGIFVARGASRGKMQIRI